MPWVFALLALVLIVALALVLAGHLPRVPQPTADPYVLDLPAEPTATDLDALRFPVVFRGYRMQEVDAAMAVLRSRIADLEARTGQATVAAEPFAPIVADVPGQEPTDG